MVISKFQKLYIENSRIHLGLPKITTNYKKKFLIIEIDGLSYSTLKKAMKNKDMPFMKQLRKRKYKLQPFYCGLPANTFSTQTGIFYGKNDSIPGFKFVDKKEQRRFSFLQLRHAKHLEEKYYKNSFGILRNGSSITTTFSGNATNTILTLSKILDSTGPTHLSFYRYLTYYTLNPFFVSRILYYSTKEFLIELKENVYDIMKRITKGKRINHLFSYPLFPFKRIFGNSIFKELSVFGSMLDMQRNVPYIYLSLIGYDELAHFRGPFSHSARSQLLELDRAIKRIHKYSKGYDVYIISDHGMTPAIPFDRAFHYSLEEFIEDCIEKNVKSDFSNQNPRLDLLNLKLKRLKRYLYKPINLIIKVALSYPKRKSAPSKIEKNSIILEISSNLAHLYFTHSNKQLNISNINKKYPYLLDNLIQHPGIGIVIGKQNNKIYVNNKFGKVTISNKIQFEGKRFLQDYGDEKVLIKQIKDFMKIKNIGDLVIIGDYDGKQMVSFNPAHLGTHTAFGGEQGQAFFMSKQDLDLSKVTNARELFTIFERYHKKNKK